MLGKKKHQFQGQLVRLTVKEVKGSVIGILLGETPEAYQMGDEQDLSRAIKFEVRKENVIIIELEEPLRNYELHKINSFVSQEPTSKFSV